MLNVLKASALRERLQRGLQVLENITVPEGDDDLAKELQELKERRWAAIKAIDAELNKPVIPLADAVRAYAAKELEETTAVEPDEPIEPDDPIIKDPKEEEPSDPIVKG